MIVYKGDDTECHSYILFLNYNINTAAIGFWIGGNNFPGKFFYLKPDC